MTSVPTVECEGWTQTDSWSRTVFRSLFVTVEASSNIYDRPECVAFLESNLPSEINQSPRFVFTTKLSFRPSLPSNKAAETFRSVVAQRAGRGFGSSLEDDGFLDVERVGSRPLSLPGDRTATAFQYEAAYPLTDDGTLPVSIWMALWPTEGTFAMCGGCYPTGSLTGLSAAVDELPTALRLSPEQARTELFDCMASAVLQS